MISLIKVPPPVYGAAMSNLIFQLVWTWDRKMINVMYGGEIGMDSGLQDLVTNITMVDCNVS